MKSAIIPLIIGNITFGTIAVLKIHEISQLHEEIDLRSQIMRLDDKLLVGLGVMVRDESGVLVPAPRKDWCRNIVKGDDI